MSTKWQRYSVITVIEAHRPGWRGALDALVAAITGRPALAVPTKVEVEVYCTQPVHLSLIQINRIED